MTTNYKSLFALLASTLAAANLSCSTQSAWLSGIPAAEAPAQYQARVATPTRQPDDVPDVLPAATEKISQTVFPIPDILCATSPNALKPMADHLDDNIAATLDDLRKPGCAKANMPGGPIVKVHPEGGIVVFSGTWEQTELVRSTLHALTEAAQDREGKTFERAEAAARRAMESSKLILPLN